MLSFRTFPWLLLMALFYQNVTNAQFTAQDFQTLQWRNIGPANMMGRIADIDALHTDYRHVLCASASGGVFQSKNAGLTWDPIFDQAGAGSIGSVALHQTQPEIIWVGTGESANRNSSGWGDGLYKSEDGGQSFRRVGFSDSHHIADIALHPTDPAIAYVAVVGHLWGYSGERGLYKTEDGGTTWKKLRDQLPDDGKTGCTEIVMHPDQPDILFAGFYHRLRQPYYYTSGGKQGGLFRSEDGGETWDKVTQGLPTGDTGMIDVSICRNYPDIMVAAIEADENLPTGVPGSGVYRSDDGGRNWRFLFKHAVRPFYHGQIEIDPSHPDTIYVVSRDFQITYDGGKTFRSRNWRTDGGDDHAMWIAPYDSKIMYLGTDQGLRLSIDAGENILSFNNMAIGQYYAIGADLRDPYWVGGGLQDNGLWIGPSNSREVRGIINEHNTWLGEGDGFHFQVDPTDWRTTYLVNHVGFAVRVNRETREHEYVTPIPTTITNYRDHFDPQRRDQPIDYTINPGEHWFYYQRTGRVPLPPQFRFNWSSPLVLSPTLPQRIYFAGNHVFRSEDQGRTWRIISPDLTGNDPRRRDPSKSGYLTRSVTGGENHYTIVTVAESPLDTNVVWAGTDDGYLHVSRNGGEDWTEVGIRLPDVPRQAAAPDREYGGTAWVSRVEPSRFRAGRCYVTLDNHRYDDMRPYVFVTEDYGQNWRPLHEGLPEAWSCYVVREDPWAENLLYVGTETAVHVSLNRGQHWSSLRNNMPQVAIHDLVVHPREGDLIAGTHGRSIWIMDDLSGLRALAQSGDHGNFAFLPSRRSTRWRSINTGRKQPHFEFRGENPAPGGLIQYWLTPDQLKASTTATIIITGTDEEIAEFERPIQPGLNRVYWDLNFPAVKPQAAIDQTLRTIEQLKTSVITSKERAMLNDLQGDYQELDSNYDPERHRSLRRKLVADFGRYGFPIGQLAEERAAPAGQYTVTIQYGEQIVSGQLELRDDPLLGRN